MFATASQEHQSGQVLAGIILVMSIQTDTWGNTNLFEMVCKEKLVWAPQYIGWNKFITKKLSSFIINFYCICVSGIDLIISESPGSVIDSVHTLKYLPQAVPSSILFPE